MSKKLDTQDFIKRDKAIFGDKYDYQKTDLDKRDDKNKVTVTCPIHCDFKISIYKHLSGQGCKQCGHINAACKCFNNARKRFVERATNKHNGKYSYEHFVYLGKEIKGLVTCPIHGDFEMTPHKHLAGYGCRKCMIDDIQRRSDEKRLKAKSEFKERLQRLS